MTATTLQIAIVVAVLASLVWLAVRRSKSRGARRPPGDHSWSGDAVCNIADAGQHRGAGGHDGGSGHSSNSGDNGGGNNSGGDSGGGADGGGSSSD